MDKTPVPVPMLTSLLVDAIHEANEAEGKRPKAFDTLFRHSDAGKCARQIAFGSLGYAETEPMDLAGEWVTTLGTLIHTEWQTALVSSHPDAQIEVRVRFGDLSSGHIDALVDIPWEVMNGDEPWPTTPILAQAADGPREGMLDLDRGDGGGQVRNDGTRTEGDGQPADPRPELRDIRGADTRGLRSGSPVPRDDLRQSEAPGSGDPSGESSEARPSDHPLSEEPRLRRGQHLSGGAGEPGLSGVPEREQQEIPTGSYRVAVELKTMGSFGFDKAMGLMRKNWNRKDPEGPRLGAIIQGSLNALASGADLLVIGIIGLEAMSKGYAEKVGASDLDRIMGEWHYSREEFEPLALAELDRLREIEGWLKADTLPPRWGIDDNGRSVEFDPEGSQFPCGYCSWKSMCLFAGSAPVSLPIPGLREWMKEDARATL